MKHVPTLFKRDSSTGLVIPELTQGTEWVARGEGVPLAWLDGLCCMFRNSTMYKRYVIKPNEDDGTHTVPQDFVNCGEANGKLYGWLPVDNSVADKLYRRVWHSLPDNMPTASYEIIGREINDNSEPGMYEYVCAHANPATGEDDPKIVIVPHCASFMGYKGQLSEPFVVSKYQGADGPTRLYNDIRNALSHETCTVNGVVWWRDDTLSMACDKAKITRADFGLPRLPWNH